jgi:hypothetical protein
MRTAGRPGARSSSSPRARTGRRRRSPRCPFIGFRARAQSGPDAVGGGRRIDAPLGDRRHRALTPGPYWPCESELCSPRLLRLTRGGARRRPVGFRPGFWPAGPVHRMPEGRHTKTRLGAEILRKRDIFESNPHGPGVRSNLTGSDARRARRIDTPSGIAAWGRTPDPRSRRIGGFTQRFPP